MIELLAWLAVMLVVAVLGGFTGYTLGFGAGARSALAAPPPAMFEDEQRDTLPSPLPVLNTELPAMDFEDLPNPADELSAAASLSQPPKGDA